MDRGDKWRCYRTLESLTTYILVAQDTPQIEVFSRMEDGDWRLHVVEDLQGVVRLAGIGSELRLSDVYTGIEVLQADADRPVVDLDSNE